MTAILAVEHPVTGMLVIGADGRVSAGNAIVSEGQQKIRAMVSPRCFLATAGERRLNSLLDEKVEELSYQDPWGLVSGLRVLCEEDGWEAKHQHGELGGPVVYGAVGVIVWPEKSIRGIYDFCMGGGVCRVPAGFPVGRGSGGEIAGAALLGFVEAGGWPETEVGLKSLVETSLKIAMRIDSGCGGEVSVFTC